MNLAKQVNILLENLGLPVDRMIIDPTTGGLGYGMEYSYSGHGADPDGGPDPG